MLNKRRSLFAGSLAKAAKMQAKRRPVRSGTADGTAVGFDGDGGHNDHNHHTTATVP